MILGVDPASESLPGQTGQSCELEGSVRRLRQLVQQTVLSPQRAPSDPERASFDNPRIGSDRNFGISFAIFFLAVALLPMASGAPIRAWSLIIAGLFLAVAFYSPHFFAVPNRIWFRFGLLLGKFLTPIVMGILFLAAVLPVALLLRLLRKDIIRLRPEPTLETYWVTKSTPLTAESLDEQF